MSQQDRLSAFLSYFGIGSRFLARGLIKAYRYSFSSLTGFDCRHLPTCSHYADEAIGRFGLWAGGWRWPGFHVVIRLGAPGSISCRPRCRIARAGIYPGTTAAGAAPTPAPSLSRPIETDALFPAKQPSALHGLYASYKRDLLCRLARRGGVDPARRGERPATLTCIRRQRVSNRSQRWSR